MLLPSRSAYAFLLMVTVVPLSSCFDASPAAVPEPRLHVGDSYEYLIQHAEENRSDVAMILTIVSATDIGLDTGSFQVRYDLNRTDPPMESYSETVSTAGGLILEQVRHCPLRPFCDRDSVFRLGAGAPALFGAGPFLIPGSLSPGPHAIPVVERWMPQEIEGEVIESRSRQGCMDVIVGDPGQPRFRSKEIAFKYSISEGVLTMCPEQALPVFAQAVGFNMTLQRKSVNAGGSPLTFRSGVPTNLVGAVSGIRAEWNKEYPPEGDTSQVQIAIADALDYARANDSAFRDWSNRHPDAHLVGTRLDYKGHSSRAAVVDQELYERLILVQDPVSGNSYRLEIVRQFRRVGSVHEDVETHIITSEPTDVGRVLDRNLMQSAMIPMSVARAAASAEFRSDWQMEEVKARLPLPDGSKLPFRDHFVYVFRFQGAPIPGAAQGGGQLAILMDYWIEADTGRVLWLDRALPSQ